jgi:glutaminyl-tRNA synthetase
LSERGVGEADAGILAREPRLAAYFDDAAKHGDAGTIASWVVNELAPAIRGGRATVSPAHLAKLAELLRDGTINSRIARDVLAEAQATGGDPTAIIESRGLRQMSDAAAIESIVDAVLSRHADKVTAYRAGKTALAGFFVGHVMRETNGRANPHLVQEILTRKLAGSSRPAG